VALHVCNSSTNWWQHWCPSSFSRSMISSLWFRCCILPVSIGKSVLPMLSHIRYKVSMWRYDELLFNILFPFLYYNIVYNINQNRIAAGIPSQHSSLPHYLFSSLFPIRVPMPQYFYFKPWRVSSKPVSLLFMVQTKWLSLCSTAKLMFVLAWLRNWWLLSTGTSLVFMPIQDRALCRS